MPTIPREEAEEVLACSRAFYRALESLDLDALQAVWWHEDWVSCVHPGRGLMQGWEEVLESWAVFIRNTRQMRVKVSGVQMRVEGDTAWAFCLEEATLAYESGFDSAVLEVTHVFVRRDDEWRLAHRHANISPASPSTEQTSRVQ